MPCLWVYQVEKLKAKFEVLSKGGVSKVSLNILNILSLVTGLLRSQALAVCADGRTEAWVEWKDKDADVIAG